MATITLQQKTELINNSKFQQRFIAAVKEHARWQNGNVISEFGHYNVANQKLKKFATQVIKTGIGVDFISEFVTKTIGEIPDTINVEGVEHPSLETLENPFDVQTNQFSDVYLSNNAIIVTLLAQYAGIEPGDDEKQIIL